MKLFCIFIVFLAIQIATLQSSEAKSSELSWVKSFSIGTVVKGEVQEIKEFGLVLSFKDYPDVVGFIANHHCKYPSS